MEIMQLISFGIENLNRSLDWIFRNKPESIFQERVFAQLKNWNEKYGICYSCYLCEEVNSSSLEFLFGKYSEELVASSSWIKWGWKNKEKSQRECFEKIQNIIIKNSEKKLGFSTGRGMIHKFDRNFLLKNAKNEIRSFYLTDDEISFLTDEEKELFVEKGFIKTIIYEEEFYFVREDIYKGSNIWNMPVKEWLKYTEQKQKVTKRLTNILISGVDFDDNIDKIEEYFEGLSNIEIPLYVSVAGVVGNNMYFLTCNSDAVYTLNLNTYQVTNLGIIGGTINNRLKFSGMGVYRNELWLIPIWESYIYVYNIDENSTLKLPLPQMESLEKNKGGFRKPVQKGDDIWLLPNKDQAVIKLNMKERTYMCFRKWPKGVSFSENSRMNFKMMFENNEKLYLLKDGCSDNIVVDMLTGEMTVWDINLCGCFARVYKDNLYLSPKKNEQVLQVRRYDNKEKTIGNLVCECNISSDITNDCQIYSYWYIEAIDEKIFFLPHESEKIVIYDINKEKFCEILCETNRDNILHSENTYGYGACEICQYKEQYIMVPYMRNKVVILDKSGEMKTVNLTCAARDIVHNAVELQEGTYSLKTFLYQTPKISSAQWNNQLCYVGTTIYKAVCPNIV